MPKDLKVALESFNVWNESSVLAENSFEPSNERSSMVYCISLGNPERWCQEAHHMTMVIAMECAAVSCKACKAVRARRWPSEVVALNCSLLSSSSK